MSIRLRLAALFTIGVIALITVGGYVYLRQLRSGLERSLDQSLQARASMISTALVTRPTIHLPAAVSSDVQLYAADGRVLDSGSVLRGDRLLTVSEVRRAAANGSALHLDRMVNLHSEDNGGPELMRIYGTRTGKADLVIALATSHDLIDDAVARSRHQLMIFGFVVVILAAPGSWLLARSALRPVERMRSQVANLKAADVGAGVRIPRTRDEVARLGRTFNELLARLSGALDREREFVADAGHELRTPLSVLKGEFELAQRPGRSREDLLETVGIAVEETDRLVRLTENLLVLAREGNGIDLGPVDLADIVSASVAAATGSATAREVALAVRDEASGVVDADAVRLRQAIDNLLTNAIRYSPAGGTVSVVVSLHESDAVVQVTDDGPGFPSEFLPRAFERFARADDARGRPEGGSGLGLAIVAAVVAEHGGTAVAANRPSGGAVVTLRWPHVADAGCRPNLRSGYPSE